jgi:uncharacterized protein YbaR (Trm112 family)
MDTPLLNILACPACKTTLEPQPQDAGLLCRSCGLLFPVIDGIPVLLVDEAAPIGKPDE